MVCGGRYSDRSLFTHSHTARTTTNFIRTRDNTPIRSPWGGKRQPYPKCQLIFIHLSGPLRKNKSNALSTRYESVVNVRSAKKKKKTVDTAKRVKEENIFCERTETQRDWRRLVESVCRHSEKVETQYCKRQYVA